MTIGWRQQYYLEHHVSVDCGVRVWLLNNTATSNGSKNNNDNNDNMVDYITFYNDHCIYLPAVCVNDGPWNV